eukprot:8875021-Pyramimonas_sp.AAC.1
MGDGVDVKGSGVNVKGGGVDVKGYGVDVKGYGVDVKGYGCFAGAHNHRAVQRRLDHRHRHLRRGRVPGLPGRARGGH